MLVTQLTKSTESMAGTGKAHTTQGHGGLPQVCVLGCPEILPRTALSSWLTLVCHSPVSDDTAQPPSAGRNLGNTLWYLGKPSTTQKREIEYFFQN